LRDQQATAVIQPGPDHRPETILVRQFIGDQIILDPDIAYTIICHKTGRPANQIASLSLPTGRLQ